MPLQNELRVFVKKWLPPFVFFLKVVAHLPLSSLIWLIVTGIGVH